MAAVTQEAQHVLDDTTEERTAALILVTFNEQMVVRSLILSASVIAIFSHLQSKLYLNHATIFMTNKYFGGGNRKEQTLPGQLLKGVNKVTYLPDISH